MALLQGTEKVLLNLQSQGVRHFSAQFFVSGRDSEEKSSFFLQGPVYGKAMPFYKGFKTICARNFQDFFLLS